MISTSKLHGTASQRPIWRLPLEVCLAAWVAASGHGAAWGLINPSFTPVHLVRQAEEILLLELPPPDDQGQVAGAVRRCLKGQSPPRVVVVHLSAAGSPEQGKAARQLLAGPGGKAALLFRGKGEKDEPISYLHVAGRWLALRPGADGAWVLAGIDDQHMPAVWAGGTDMLARAVDLLLRRPGTIVPVEAGCSWTDKDHRIGAAAGTVHAAAAVDLAGDGRLALHVSAEGGDRLFRYDPDSKSFADLTGKLALGARSSAAAWGDYNADGRLDLASWDGAALSLHVQGGDGRFTARTVDGPPAGQCLGLTSLAFPTWRSPGVLWAGPAGPVLLTPAEGGALKAGEPLDAKGLAGASLGRPGACLAADFDGDCLPDVLWTFERGSLLFRGTAEGAFRKACPCAVARGAGRAAAMVGDFDADGLLDVLAVSEKACMVWQNRGRGAFEEAFSQSGELEHVYEGGGTAGNVCDFNGDGLQDVFIVCASRRPLLFFNRGFRSFGHAHSLDLLENQRLRESHQGQQAGVVADFDGDGAQDLALVLPDGSVWMVLGDWSEPPLTVRVALPPGRAPVGPLTVTGWDGDRCLGAWNVTAGTGEAVFGRSTKGPITLTWRLGGAAKQSRTIVVLKPMRIALVAEKGESR